MKFYKTGVILLFVNEADNSCSIVSHVGTWFKQPLIRKHFHGIYL